MQGNVYENNRLHKWRTDCEIDHGAERRGDAEASSYDHFVTVQATSPDRDPDTSRDARTSRKRDLDGTELLVKTVKKGSSRPGKCRIAWEAKQRSF